MAPVLFCFCKNNKRTIDRSLMQVSWPRPACTHTRAPPSPPCPVAALTSGIVVRVPSKSFSAARKNRRLQSLSHRSCALSGCCPPTPPRSRRKASFASSGRAVYASWDVSMLLNVVNGPCCTMPATAACPTPTAPTAAGPAPAPAAGANPPAGPPTPLVNASAASMASLTRARVAAPPAFRAQVASHPRPAVLRTPHHSRPAHASARCTSTIDLVGTADVAATTRTHRVCCPLLVKRRTLPPQALTKFRICRPLINHADLCYQVCGNGT